MLKKILLLFGILVPIGVFSQVFNGKVYGQDEVLENVLIQNKTQKTQTLTDAKGDFKITAPPNDSIIFSASFFEPQSLRVDIDKLFAVWVVELMQ